MTQVRLQKQLLDWREVDGEVIALEHERSAYLAANRSGALLWRALDEGTTEAELAKVLVDEYGLDPARAHADVAAFLVELDERGLLESR